MLLMKKSVLKKQHDIVFPTFKLPKSTKIIK